MRKFEVCAVCGQASEQGSGAVMKISNMMLDRKKTRPLTQGELVQEGDVLVYGEGLGVFVRKCKYDPGCCAGKEVASNELYYRIDR